MIERSITYKLREKLSQVPAVALLGARQVGKTTLAKSIASETDSIYLDLEAPEDLLKLSDASGFLKSNAGKLIVLDEIQRRPELFSVLRGIIDINREKGFRSGQFLILGSASMGLMRQSSQSLAGRISYLEMGGFNLTETTCEARDRQNLWIRGGFPDSYLAPNGDVAMDWLEDLIRTYLERDVPQMGFRVPASRLRRLWTMLAHLQGETINNSRLASNLEVDAKTISHYIDILVDLLLLRRLQPWHRNVKKRLVKSPRYYVRDSGILHRLLGVHSHDALLSNPILGKSWEGFVVENIHCVLPPRAESYFYRTAAGAEIDLVVIMPSSEIWAIEVKHGVAPKINRHLSQTCNDVDATHKFIVYGGNDEFMIGNGLTVISLPLLLERIVSTS